MQPRTMVEQAAEAIVAAAARGAFLPGDRLVEAEIARDLGISRVPVREALRLLESQGIVNSTPYKGMRLMEVTNAGVAALMRVRLALETQAIGEALAQPGGLPVRFKRLGQAAEDYALAAQAGDPAAIVLADVAFHRELCRASGNAPLLALWQSLSRQLAVVWGLGRQGRDAAPAAREHAALVQALLANDRHGAADALSDHVNWHQGFDFEAVLNERRGAAATVAG
ncbi:MAG: GntR family transcriptional regulator [Acetobacteraceae bacterium]|nr:GntR family transcriptional regulator [Acetobacteraceae bacterium]